MQSSWRLYLKKGKNFPTPPKPINNDLFLRAVTNIRIMWWFNLLKIPLFQSFNRALVYCRWLSAFGAEYRRRVFTKTFGHLVFPLKHLIARHITKRIKRDLWGHGMGRHSEQELYGIAQRDLQAVSEILGQKKFLFGDKPCLADVALFAFVAASTWDLPESPFDELIKTKAQNLHTHAQRMKELYYPDWDEITSRNATSR